MQPEEFIEKLTSYIKQLEAGQLLNGWKYEGKTNIAFGSPGGSWNPKDFAGHQFSKGNKIYIFRPASKRQIIAIESISEKYQVVNYKLSDKTFKEEGNLIVIYENFIMTVKVKKKISLVKEAMYNAGFGKDDIILKFNASSPDFTTIISDFFKWANIREKARETIRAANKPEDKSGTNTDSSGEKTPQNSIPLNQILYGPPGTGKTYNAIPRALNIIDPSFVLKDTYSAEEWEVLKEQFDNYRKSGQIEFITFHQSLNYEDFVEGIKPIEPNTNENLTDIIIYKVQDGIFKSICIEASKTKNLIADTPGDKNENIVLEEHILKSYYDRFVNTLPDQENDASTFVFETKADKTKFWLYKNSAKSIVVKAGSKKTNMPISFKEISMVAFNRKEPAYKSYTPVIIDKLIEDAGFRENTINNSSKNFVLIIDEINRGNVSAIFGELITLLEATKRVGGFEHLKIKLPYSKTDFEVPPNLYIIGTMNTADRSVEALDTALRRRFSFVEMPPRYDLEDLQYEFKGYTASKILATINRRIEKLLDRDHLIGHSYFLMKQGDDIREKLLNTFYNNIIPLLQEYFFGDFAKIGAVLGKGFIFKDENNSFDFASGFDSEDFIEKDIFQIIDYRLKQLGNQYIQSGMSFEKAVQLLMNKQQPE
jgi:5-methylcytosine-specific restriction enzyme B